MEFVILRLSGISCLNISTLVLDLLLLEYAAIIVSPWWRHQMETFSALLALCAGNSPVTGEFPAQRLVTRSFDVFLDLRLNKPLSKQSWGWWFETPSRPLWCHCNACWILRLLVKRKLLVTNLLRFNLKQIKTELWKIMFCIFAADFLAAGNILKMALDGSCSPKLSSF